MPNHVHVFDPQTSLLSPPHDFLIEYLYHQTQDHKNLRFAIAKQDDKQAPLLAILTGRTEFIEKYHEVMGSFYNKGYSIIIFDWRGQGLSQRLLSTDIGHIDDFKNYQYDLATLLNVAQTHFFKPPDYVIAHSMGGHLLTQSILMRDHVRKMVLISPMLQLKKQWMIKVILKTMMPVFAFMPNLLQHPVFGMKANQFKNSAFDGNPYTSCQMRYLRNAAYVQKNHTLTVGVASFQWLRQAIQSIDELQNGGLDVFFEGVKPNSMMAFTGDQDQIIDPKIITELLQKYPDKIKISSIQNARHEPLHESNDILVPLLHQVDQFFNS